MTHDKKETTRRPLALITGAGGGMGAASARVLSRRYRLILAELTAEPLTSVADPLRRDGANIVGAVTGDISAPETIATIGRLIEENGGLDALVHTAGISPTMGSWEQVLRVNLTATLNLLDAVEPRLVPGAAGVLIASLAAQLFDGSPEIDATLKAVTADTVDGLEPLVRSVADDADPLSLSGAAYKVSKYAVKLICESRARQWGERGARLTSISPGLIATSMGLAEAQGNTEASGLAEQAPVGRWGTALDVAEAVEFLLSDAASFISGCDLRVDGGLAARLNDVAGVGSDACG
ncbi:NAD(P)-dependent dehydrogenase (short-subunit alcohol dehydrogenase family) [Pseudarthrobacter siccitolerans]|uniref:NAD(P)-dependent dehydrogenase (Short-subunit alcohol dehydrogenase family) n=1 Tax=Pseudarthrobacter siccitolerans TaxID=861266 RepID=A0ABU0PL78_9MICC|nr:SDR family oxidoreductase [Pseudarthrobacter siccitolerans]MDQ0674690.1 NAD(P)-dependent dehydrogenase (short-subunit alcohol dehydrogenase family) [Pseudarthrobacter siccitolerans]